MARIEVATHIAASPERVWDVLTDWEGQTRWMRDARAVTVLSPHGDGIGVVVRCMTRIAGGLTVTDDLVTTRWERPHILEVRHLGWLIRGVAAFDLEAVAGGTRLVWWEEIDPPAGALGEAVANAAVVPLVARVFRGSLVDLRGICEGSSVRP